MGSEKLRAERARDDHEQRFEHVDEQQHKHVDEYQFEHDDESYSQVTPLGPTSGPSGFGLAVGVPDCSPAGLHGYVDGVEYGYGGFDGGSPEVIRSGPLFLTTGTHTLSYSCNGSWTDPGFAVTVTGPGHPGTLAAASVQAGQDIVFTSGASAGPSPRPDLSDASHRGGTPPLPHSSVLSVLRARQRQTVAPGAEPERAMARRAPPRSGREACSSARWPAPR